MSDPLDHTRETSPIGVEHDDAGRTGDAPDAPATRRDEGSRVGDAAGPGASIVLVGLGNIGSATVAAVARMPGIASLTLIDPQRYEPRNLVGQTLLPEDVGRPKAEAMAERARAIAPHLRVDAIAAAVEDVPPGRLRCNVMLTGLDSRRARCIVNRLVRGLAIRWWIDAGVEPEGLMARVSVHASLPGSPCHECSWSEDDYRLIDRRHACDGGPDEAPATNAPAALGQLAASMQALELHALLGGAVDRADRQVTMSCTHDRHFVTGLRQSPSCLCDHEPWAVERLDASSSSLTVAQALDLIGPASAGEATLAVDGSAFVRSMSCRACGRRRTLLRLAGRVPPRQQRCDRCGDEMQAIGFESLDRLGDRSLHARVLAQPLAQLGFEPGDHFTVRRDERRVRFELPSGRR